jgi:ATP-dependent Lon protease
VGGIKEKMLAAKRAGIKKLILPLENKPGMADFEDDIMQGMEINYVSHVSEVLELVLEGGLKPTKAKPAAKNPKAKA